MVDINALNMTLWGITLIAAVAVTLAVAGILLAWVNDRSRRAQQVTTGARAAEEHLEEAARKHAA